MKHPLRNSSTDRRAICWVEFVFGSIIVHPFFRLPHVDVGSDKSSRHTNWRGVTAD
jgi:hypothetical protein